jgi:hypothetical protein
VLVGPSWRRLRLNAVTGTITAGQTLTGTGGRTALIDQVWTSGGTTYLFVGKPSTGAFGAGEAVSTPTGSSTLNGAEQSIGTDKSGILISGRHVQVHNLAAIARHTDSDSRCIKIAGANAADLRTTGAVDTLIGGVFLPAVIAGIQWRSTDPYRATQAYKNRIYGVVAGSPGDRIDSFCANTESPDLIMRFNEFYCGGSGAAMIAKQAAYGLTVTNNIMDAPNADCGAEFGNSGVSAAQGTYAGSGDPNDTANWRWDDPSNPWRSLPIDLPAYPGTLPGLQGEIGKWADVTGRIDENGNYERARIERNILRTGPGAAMRLKGAMDVLIKDNFITAPFEFSALYNSTYKNSPFIDPANGNYDMPIPASLAGVVTYQGTAARPGPIASPTSSVGNVGGYGRWRLPVDAPLTRDNAGIELRPEARILVWLGCFNIAFEGLSATFGGAVWTDQANKGLPATFSGMRIPAMPDSIAVQAGTTVTGTIGNTDETAFRARFPGEAFGAAGWDKSVVYAKLGMA